MPLATATITLNVADLLGNALDQPAEIRVRTNIPNETVVDTDGNRIRVGEGRASLNYDGTGVVTVWVPGAGSNPVSWQTYLDLHYTVPGERRQRVRSFGPFTITGNADLADLVAAQPAPPNFAYSLDGGTAATRDDSLQLRRGTAAEWTSANPVLRDGEAGVETDTGLLKLGDGITPWAARPYAGEGPTPTGYYSGTGFPEGVVTAPVGSVYRDTAATNGAVTWVKATGTGNTGWVVVAGDTGRRSLTGAALNGWSLSYADLTRVGKTVELVVSGTIAAATSSPVLNLPAGFRPPRSHDYLVLWNAGVGSGRARVTSGGDVQPGSAQTNFNATLSWMTRDAWPSGALPGTPL